MANLVWDICEKALRRCGENATLPADFLTNPQSKAARLLVRFYDDARQEVLRAEPWTCIAKRAPLVADTVLVHHTGRTYAWDVPADYIREIDVVDALGQPVDYLQEGGHFFTNHEEPILIYVPDSADPTAWDPLLRESVVLNLASKIGYPLTATHEAEVSLSRIAQGFAGMAAQKSARESRQAPESSDEWMPGLFPERRPK